MVLDIVIGEFDGSGIPITGSTKTCALPSTFQALPSPAQQEPSDFIKN